jgi:tape measure domain-containing protein
MSDGSNWVLKLIDKLTPAANAMSRALGGLIKSETAATSASAGLQTSATKAGAAVASAGATAARAAAGFDRAAKAMKATTAAANALRVAQGSTSWANVKVGFGGAKYGARPMSGGIAGHMRGAAAYGPVYDPSAQGAAAGGMGPIFDRKAQGRGGLLSRIGDGLEDGVAGLQRWNSTAGESISKWKELASSFMSTPFGMVLGGLGKVGGALLDIVGSLASVLFTAGKVTLALGAIAAVSFAKKAVEMASFAESSKQALAFLTGGKATGDSAFNQGVSLAKQLGTDIEETTHQLIKLRSMQFSVGEGIEIIKLGADLKAITGDAQSAERAIVAMTQIKAKGKLQSEELVGQLAEAGVSTVLVYEQLEKLLGKDRKGVMAQISAGQVDAATGLEAIKKAIMHKVGTDTAGEVGAAFANKTFGGLATSLKTAFDGLMLDVGRQIDLSPLMDAMRAVKASLSFSDTGAMARFVNSMIAGVSKLIPLVIDFAQGFGTGLESISRALSFGDAGNLKQWAFDAGQGTANFFAKVIEVTKEVGAIIPGALKALFDGLDVNGLLASLKTMDWAKLGQDFMAIANALGSLLNNAAALARFVMPDSEAEKQRKVGVLQNMQNDWSWMNPFADAKPATMAPVEPKLPEGVGNGKTVQQKNNVTVHLTPPAGASREDVQVMSFDVMRAARKELTRMADTELAEAL